MWRSRTCGQMAQSTRRWSDMRIDELQAELRRRAGNAPPAGIADSLPTIVDNGRKRRFRRRFRSVVVATLTIAVVAGASVVILRTAGSADKSGAHELRVAAGATQDASSARVVITDRY